LKSKSMARIFSPGYRAKRLDPLASLWECSQLLSSVRYCYTGGVDCKSILATETREFALGVAVGPLARIARGQALTQLLFSLRICKRCGLYHDLDLMWWLG
jgi:hypothetical protein